MAAIVESIEVSRRPEDVFSYVTDATHLPDWQESVVRVRPAGEANAGAGTRHVVTRRIGRREREMTVEMNTNAPTDWTVRGVDGPVRGMVKGTVEPIADGERARVTIELDFIGHGIGMILVPLVVRSQAKAEMPRNMLNLRDRLEAPASAPSGSGSAAGQ
jgi:uncharacterized protein YndB with AHSA1/START domain